MKTVIFNVLIFFAFTIFTFCTEPYDIDLPETESNRLIVEGKLTTEKTIHKVIISRSSGYFYNLPPKMETGAKVFITCENDTIFLNESEKAGIYLTENIAGEIGKTYTLHIKTGNEFFEATTTIPRTEKIDSISFRYVKSGILRIGQRTNKGIYNILFYAQELPSPSYELRDFIMFELYLDNKLYTDSLDEKQFLDDGAVDGKYIDSMRIFRLAQDSLQTDTVIAKVKMYCVSEGFYNFWLGFMFETRFKGGPFSATPSNAPTNITNKTNPTNNGLGYFWAASVDSAFTKIIKVKPDSTQVK